MSILRLDETSGFSLLKSRSDLKPLNVLKRVVTTRSVSLFVRLRGCVLKEITGPRNTQDEGQDNFERKVQGDRLRNMKP